MVSSLATNGPKRQLEDWNQINWKKVNKLVRNLRTRIFRARKLGNFRKLRSLQKLMLRSYANLLLSIRRITQTNQGKATAGIDKEVVNTPQASASRQKFVTSFYVEAGERGSRGVGEQGSGGVGEWGSGGERKMLAQYCSVNLSPSPSPARILLANLTFRSRMTELRWSS
jgi:hypothetical protein